MLCFFFNHLLIERQTTVLEAPPKQKARGTQPPQPVSRVWRSLPTLPRVWPHSGHDVHEGCPLVGGSNLGRGVDFPPNGKQGTKRGPEYPGNIFGEGKAKKDKLQWEGPPNILSARKTQLPKPSPWGRIRRNKECSRRVLVFPFCPEGARGRAVETSSPRFRNSIHEAAR